MRQRGSWSGNERDVLFLNVQGPRFIETAYGLGLDFVDDGRAVVAVDVDGDGDLDLAIHSLQQLRLVENRMPRRRFARVRLQDTRGDRHALGSVVHVEAGGVVQQDYVKATAGFGAQTSLDLHFGLADAARIDKLTVRWRDGATEEFRDLPVDRLLKIRRGAGSVDVSELPRWPEATRPRTPPRFSLEEEVARLEGGRGRLVGPSEPVVVNFWSPSCAPCRTELPELVAFSRRARVVGVSVERQDLDAVRAVVKEFGLTYPQFVADDALLAGFFGSDGQAPLPSTFVFDAEGRLRRAFHRSVTGKELGAVLDSFGRGTFHVDYLIEGIQQLQLGNLEAAVRSMEQAVAENPRYALGHYHLGLLRAQQRRLEDAIALFHRAIALEPKYAKAHHNLGAALLDAGRAAEAELSLRNALQLDPRPETHQMLGQTLAAQEFWDKAEQEFREALLLNPQHLGSLLDLGVLLIRMGRHAEARSVIEQAQQMDPAREDIRRLLQQLQ
jgi:Flp pilus assembly protein TadD/peroxiredoxin